MWSLGIETSCSFPYTGENCTDDYTAQLHPAIEYSNWVGLITCVMLTVPSVLLARTSWKEFRSARNQSGPGLRVVCSLSLMLAGFFSILLFATGMLITHPADTGLGALSFLAAMVTNCSYTVATLCVLFVSRRVYLATITHHGRRQVRAKILHEVSEVHMAIVFLTPTMVGFSTTTILAVSGAVSDNVTLIRINVASTAVYLCNVALLTRTYGRPVIKALNALCQNSKSKGSDEGLRKAQDLATKLGVALRSQEYFGVIFVTTFTIISLTNVLAIPEVSSIHSFIHSCMYVVCGVIRGPQVE
jgi:hypothetical protein